jgi:hypothetical protein
MFPPFPGMIGGLGRSLIIAPVVYNTATAGDGYSRVSHGGLTNAGGEIFPNTVDGYPIDALIGNDNVGLAYIAIYGGVFPKSFFTSIVIPGLNGGAPFLTAAAGAYGAVSGGYNATFWSWAAAGSIANGQVYLK